MYVCRTARFFYAARLVSPDKSREDCDCKAMEIPSMKRCGDDELNAEPTYHRTEFGHAVQTSNNDGTSSVGKKGQLPVPGHTLDDYGNAVVDVQAIKLQSPRPLPKFHRHRLCPTLMRQTTVMTH